MKASIAKKRNIIIKKFHFSTELSDTFSKMGLMIRYDIPIFKEDRNKKANPTFSKLFFAITSNITKVTFEKIKNNKYKVGMLYWKFNSFVFKKGI